MNETIMEIAEREAAEAENGTDEHAELEPDAEIAPETEPEGEPETEPVPAPEAGFEAAYKKLDKASDTYTKAVLRVFETAPLPLTMCPCCERPGLVLPFNPDDPNEQIRKSGVEAYFGAAKPKLKHHPAMATCDKCDGQGFLDTGSHREGYTEETCDKCGGQGWTRTDAPGPQSVTLPVSPGNGGAQPWSPPGAPPKPEPYYDYAEGVWKIA